MGAPLELEQHRQRVGLIDRLLQHVVPDDDRRVGTQHQPAAHPERFLPGQPLDVIQRGFQRTPHFGYVRGDHPQRNAKHFEQLAPPG